MLTSASFDMKGTTPYIYRCRHCGKPYPESFLAELCFAMDMTELTKEKKNIPHAPFEGGIRKDAKFTQNKLHLKSKV
jgi:hypothetical protein